MKLFKYIWNNQQKRNWFIAINIGLAIAWPICVMQGVWWFASIATGVELGVFFIGSWFNFNGKQF